MNRLTLNQYRNMVGYILKYKESYGKLPEYVTIEKYKIIKKDYIDMMERVNKFILEMGRNPRTVDIGTTETIFNY